VVNDYAEGRKELRHIPVDVFLIPHKLSVSSLLLRSMDLLLVVGRLDIDPGRGGGVTCLSRDTNDRITVKRLVHSDHDEKRAVTSRRYVLSRECRRSYRLSSKVMLNAVLRII
jgi:hypothetical protein